MSTKTAGIAFALFILLSSADGLHLHGWLAKRCREKSTNQWHPPGASNVGGLNNATVDPSGIATPQDGAATPAAHHRPVILSSIENRACDFRAAMPADSGKCDPAHQEINA